MMRITFFFECNKWGWTETHYCSLTTAEGAIALAIRDYPARLEALAPPAFLSGIRASDDDAAQDSLFYVPSHNDGLASSTLGLADIPNTAVDVRMEAGAGHRRTLMMRGIPDVIVTNGGQLDGGQWAAVGAAAWKRKLLTPNWGMRVRNSAAGAVGIRTMLNNFTLGTVTITTTVPHGLNDGDLAYISGRSNTKGFNGTWKVVRLTDTTFDINSRVFAQFYFIGLKVRKLSYTFARYTDFIIERATHRVTGRPFGSPVGRRRGRALR